MSACSSTFRLPNLPNISPQNHNIVMPTTVFLSLRHSTATNPALCKLQCVGNNFDSTPKTIEIPGKITEESADCEPRIHSSGGDGGAGDSPGGGGGGGGDSGGGGGDGEGNDGEEKEFGPILKFEEVMKEIELKGVGLPDDMMEAAKTVGIRKMFLLRYLDLQGSVWPLGFLMRYCFMLRDRMLADPSFLFKVGTEIVIDSCCATLAEFQKRGKDFWSEFELYLADLLVGLVVDIALVGMLAPYARIGQPSASSGLFGRIQNACGSLPSSVFEAERPGCRFSVKQRIATYFYKVLQVY
ncbi:hypothetical protein CISIN_1g015583mg [Citrus sinensis]|uniref:Uncharacterized protein n=1 Tax=Citrus sinensis TaxID=2711 RepID=A0A067E407_CITSI|nr:hypothetical protein CISIN_1g015583mg [Citrus sinensis]